MKKNKNKKKRKVLRKVLLVILNTEGNAVTHSPPDVV